MQLKKTIIIVTLILFSFFPVMADTYSVSNLKMNVPIYIFLSTVGIVFMLISVLYGDSLRRQGNDILIIKWITFLIFIMLGITSFNINRDFCEYVTDTGWSCHVQQYKMGNLAYFWYGLGVIMFIYAFYSSVVQPAKEIVDRIT